MNNKDNKNCVLKFLKDEAVGLIFAIGVLLILFFTYNLLPNNIVTHYNLEGVADSYSDKSISWIFASIPLLIHILLLVAKKFDPKSENFEKFENTYRKIRQLVTVFLSILMLCTFILPSIYSMDVPQIVIVIISLMFVGIGNYLLSVKQNYIVGIRTPWTLASDMVWRKTHRLGGFEFIIVGVISFIFALFKNYLIFLPATLIMVIHFYVYSYMEYKKEQKNLQNK